MSFHLLVGEMTITLDHLPMTSNPIDHVPSIFTRENVKILLMTRLGISTKEEVITATIANARVRLMWLANLSH